MHQTNKLWLLLLLLLCSAVAVSAQDDLVPTPRPASTSTVIGELSSAVETNGALASVMVGAVVILALVVIFLIASVRVGLKPMLSANTDASQRASESQRAMIAMHENLLAWQREENLREDKSNETRRLQADSLRAAAEAQKDMVTIMKELETKHEAKLDRSALAREVNEHTSKAIKVVNDTLDQMSLEIGAVKTELQGTVSKTDLTDGMKPIVDKLNAITREIADIRNLLPGLNASKE